MQDTHTHKSNTERDQKLKCAELNKINAIQPVILKRARKRPDT